MPPSNGHKIGPEVIWGNAIIERAKSLGLAFDNVSKRWREIGTGRFASDEIIKYVGIEGRDHGS